MRTWATKKAIVHEVHFNYDLHSFEVYNKESGDFVGIVFPDNIKEMNDCITALNNDTCPIDDDWELSK